jgi:fatty-acyl-CoA synthase
MRNQGIGSWPARRARSSPHRRAVVHDGRVQTYRELSDRVTRLAHVLRGLDVRHSDRVAYLGPNHPAFVETLFATGAVGAVFVPLNTRLAAPEIEYMLADSGSSVLVYGPECAAVVAEIRDRLQVHAVVAVSGRSGAEVDFERAVAASPPDSIDEPVDPGEPCMIMYTSGTTGRPKGATLTHANITWNCYNMLIDVDLAADEVTLVSAPLFHIAALDQTYLPTFLKGGCAVIVSGFNADEALHLVEQHRVTFMFGVPAMFAAVAAAPGWQTADLSSLRTLICGGAPVPESLIRTYQQRGLLFLQGYGLTETAPGALFLSKEMSVVKAGSAGVPCFFTDVRVVRPDLTEVTPGEPGEVVISGPNVMKGYWGLPDATADAFSAGGLLRSGDVATVDEDGYVYIVDRLKDMIISGGENIYPAEVENVLYQHPTVAECAVIGVPDERWGEVGKAFVVPRPGAAADAAPLLEFLTERLAKYKVPRTVEFTDSLPRTASGKVLKSRLRRAHSGISAKRVT